MSDCVACGGPLTPGAYVLPAGSYAKCAACGLASLDPLPHDGAAGELFAEGYFKGEIAGGYADYDADQVLHEANARARMALIRRHSPHPPAAVLDMGCAVGTFLLEPRRLGARVVGVDVSPWARAEATQRHGVEVAASAAEVAASSPGGFDVVTFFQSLEHMPRPDRELEFASTCLRPGGLLVLETWDAGSLIARLMGKAWQQMNPPTVLHLMGRRSLAALLERAGFDVVRIERTGKLVSVGLVLHILAGKAPRLLGWVETLAHWPWLGRRTIRYQLGDLITVVARKRGEPA